MVKILSLFSVLGLFVGTYFTIMGFSNNNFLQICIGGFCVCGGLFNLYQLDKHK